MNTQDVPPLEDFHWLLRSAEIMSSRSMASKTPVGFIGLGNMGSPMAKNLLKHGYPVIATDVFPESCKELQDEGAQILDSPAEVADKADRIITMLPSSPNVIEVYTGPNGILKKVKKGTLLIDSSTIDPSVSKEMALAAEKMGAVFMDAPVSGGNILLLWRSRTSSFHLGHTNRHISCRALAVMLTMSCVPMCIYRYPSAPESINTDSGAIYYNEQYVGYRPLIVHRGEKLAPQGVKGGVEEEYTAAHELLTCMGANVVYCGQVGTGQAAKICNNMLLAIGMIGTAETMNLGI
ncbi:unnamed protein product, partial [Coregonus sp. 'balchen']